MVRTKVLTKFLSAIFHNASLSNEPDFVNATFTYYFSLHCSD